MNKKILLTGSTGGIGSTLAVALLEEGHELYLPVRNIEKAEALFFRFPNAHIEIRDLEDYDDMIEYCLLCSSEGISFDFVLLLAGDLRKDIDKMFAGETDEEKEKNSIEYHERVNLKTAETVVFGLQKTFGITLNQTTLLGVSSWAANFEPGHPYRKGEEGYVIAKEKLSKMLHSLKHESYFRDVICEEPSLIRSPLTEREFPELIADSKVIKIEPEDYVAHLRQILSL